MSFSFPFVCRLDNLDLTISWNLCFRVARIAFCLLLYNCLPVIILFCRLIKLKWSIVRVRNGAVHYMKCDESKTKIKLYHRQSAWTEYTSWSAPADHNTENHFWIRCYCSYQLRESYHRSSQGKRTLIFWTENHKQKQV